MSAPVFLAEEGSLDGLVPGGRYVLDGPEGRHAGVVQRRGPGEVLDVVDGSGVRVRCEVVAVDGPHLDLAVRSVEREPSDGVELVLVQALAKGDRDDLAIEAATEVGVDAVVPWQAERSVVVWRGERAEKSRSRWVSTVRAAAKQARRATVPAVAPAVDHKTLVARVTQVCDAGGTAVVLHEDARLALAQVTLPTVVAGLGRPASSAASEGAAPGRGRRQVLLVVGPEGGISDREVADLQAAGAVTARLGPHVLRTSTAGPVAVAMLSERLGRWHTRPHGAVSG